MVATLLQPSLLHTDLCRGPHAFGKGYKTLGKGFAEGCSQQRVLGKFLVGKGIFAEGYFSGTRQRFCQGLTPAFGKNKLRLGHGLQLTAFGSSVKNFLNFYLDNFFAEGSHTGPRKRIFEFFSLISLPRAPRLVFGKVSFFIFSGEFFVEGLDHSPRQRPVFYFF